MKHGEKTATVVNVVLATGRETHLPIGPLQVAAVLEAHGWSVEFRDLQLEPLSRPMSVTGLARFLDTPAAVLGVSCCFNLLPLVGLALERVRRRRPEQLIVLGGPGPSANAERFMTVFHAADIIVRGEGEETLSEILEWVAGGRQSQLDKIASITFRRDGRVVSSGTRKLARRLDALPWPAYHLANLKRYDALAVMTARGCPFGCGFCEVSPLWGRVARPLPLERAIAEMTFLVDEIGAHHIRIADDTFVLDRRRALAFASEISQRLPGVRWSCLGRIDLIDRQLVDGMAKGGCCGLQFGVESGSPRVLERVGKPFKAEQIVETVRLAAETVETVICSFIWGFPFETLDDFFMTVAMMGKIAELDALIKVLPLMPLPLSPLYREFGDALSFDAEIASAALYSGHHCDAASANNRTDVARLLALVQDYPDVFPNFFHFSSETFQAKKECVRSLGAHLLL